MGANILHVDLDAFFASVEQARNPSLLGRPVIVGGDPNGRGVVAAASYEAREYGVHSAMPMARAKRLCPGAVFLRCDHRTYIAASRAVCRILRNYSPVVEVVSIDEAYLELGGLRRLFGPPIDVADRIRREIKEHLNLSASMGLSANRLVSKVASACAKPSGLVLVNAGYEERFLAPLPINRLPGVGKKMGESLNDLGISTIGALAALDPGLIERTFGRFGLRLYRHAHGTGSVTFRERRLPLSVNREVTFDTDTSDRGQVAGTLAYLTERACRTMRRQKMSARRVTVKLRYSDFQTVTRSARLEHTTATDGEIIPSVMEVLGRAWTRRARIRTVGVSLSRLSPIPAQQDLFPQPAERRHEDLCCAIDAIRERFGFGAIMRGQALSCITVRETRRSPHRSGH